MRFGDGQEVDLEVWRDLGLLTQAPVMDTENDTTNFGSSQEIIDMKYHIHSRGFTRYHDGIPSSPTRYDVLHQNYTLIGKSKGSQNTKDKLTNVPSTPRHSAMNDGALLEKELDDCGKDEKKIDATPSPYSRNKDEIVSTGGTTHNKSIGESPYDIMKKREERMRRNEDRIKSLGLSLPMSELKNHKDHNENSSEDDDEYGPVLRKGMLFRTKHNGVCAVTHELSQETKVRNIPGQATTKPDFEANSIKPFQGAKTIEALKLRYPHRSEQVDMLYCLFETSVRQAKYARMQCIQNQNDNHDGPIEEDSLIDPYVPPPIFITGPSGTGKTSIVRDVLNIIQNKAENELFSDDSNVGVGVAYTNCSTFEPCNIGSLLKHLYGQLEKDLGKFHNKIDQKRRRRKKGYKRHRSSMNSGPSHSFSPSQTNENGDNNQNLTSAFHYDSSTPLDNIHDEFGSESDDNQNTTGNKVLSVDDEEDLIEEHRKSFLGEGVDRRNKRKRSKQALHASLPQSQQVHTLRRSSRFSSNANSQIEIQVQRHHSKKITRQSGLNIQTVMSFGRAISKFCGKKSVYSQRFDCSFLILDHAEYLLQFSLDLLSQLLLLSKTFGINLTIIVISNHLYLENLSEYYFPQHVVSTYFSTHESNTPF